MHPCSGNADTLSRRPCLEHKCRYCQNIEIKQYSNEICNELLMATTIQVEDEWSSEKLKKSQKKDSDLKELERMEIGQLGRKFPDMLMVVMYYFSKWPEAVPLPNQEAETVAEAFIENVIARHGVPLELHSDQGRNFELELWQEVIKILGIKKTRSTALHPQSNGMVERHNRTICHYLSKFVSENQRDWDKLVSLFLLSYRSSQHGSTTYTPSMLTSVREMKLPTDLILGRPLEENQERSLPEFIIRGVLLRTNNLKEVTFFIH
ncbi:hypothetical protein NQ318_009654 [Aromia moschata]|uniref:Integrase catalytic domain-containing protein n=1 Tax=Aromia moschata TaxID=1265417 RepID=A0AAV8XZH5_9CUCU|nr:hypothetical protein NQ318_009654 [Aromia moschata]